MFKYIYVHVLKQDQHSLFETSAPNVNQAQTKKKLANKKEQKLKLQLQLQLQRGTLTRLNAKFNIESVSHVITY